MEEARSLAAAQEFMRQFAEQTGLAAVDYPPLRYLWTDAFAVCNLLELYRRSGEEHDLALVLHLVRQVHEVLGTHREDDPRRGAISGLDAEEARRHPTVGGLRIGKRLNERGPGEPSDERLEWERDGQYYHYLTKWMHALHRLSRVTGEPDGARWGLELAKTAHRHFTYRPPAGGRQRLYWKMSIDLSRPLVPSMGQHDPLDGLVTFCELQAGAGMALASPPRPDLREEIAELTEICQGQSWVTDDPLGIGGLLFDAGRMSQLRVEGEFADVDLLLQVLTAAERGLEAFTVRNPFGLPAAYRLPFRELGLAIGLSAIEEMQKLGEEYPGTIDRTVRQQITALLRYVPYRGRIEDFWLEEENRTGESWQGHRDINTVMLATSLAPDGFLAI